MYLEERRTVGKTALTIPRVGLGAAALSWETQDVAISCVTSAWESGVRSFDTAPMYNNGRSEWLLGQVLAGVPRDEFVLSTKVGRLVRGNAPEHALVGDSWEFDFSADAIKRSIEHSLTRLGLDRIDILYIHDPDNHWETAINEAWPVLDDLRSQGVVKAVGAGMTQVPMLQRFAQETTMDIFLLAGRYSLLDNTAHPDLFSLTQERNISVMIAQAMHGGLIEGVPNPQIYYQPVDEATQARVATIAGICRSHGVPMAAAAIQFPLAHPAVTGVLTGPANPEQLRQNLSWLNVEIPDDLWADLKRAGILREDIPVPTQSRSA